VSAINGALSRTLLSQSVRANAPAVFLNRERG
jgi:hypothetical protein